MTVYSQHKSKISKILLNYNCNFEVFMFFGCFPLNGVKSVSRTFTLTQFDENYVIVVVSFVYFCLFVCLLSRVVVIFFLKTY